MCVAHTHTHCISVTKQSASSVHMDADAFTTQESNQGEKKREPPGKCAAKFYQNK